MDKYEYQVKTEEMLQYMDLKEYKKAMEIADGIDWKHVKNVLMLCKVSEIYEYNRDYKRSREILFFAYDRRPGSRKIVYRLGTLALKLGDTNEAQDCYEEYVNLAPKDPNQYVLLYKIQKAKGAPLDEQIKTLEDFKKVEYIEKWAYELAKLYHEAGRTDECLAECDDLILWFSEGKYVFKAMELKKQYKPLTPLQQEKYDQFVAEREVEKKTERTLTPDEKAEKEVQEELPAEYRDTNREDVDIDADKDKILASKIDRERRETLDPKISTFAGLAEALQAVSQGGKRGTEEPESADAGEQPVEEPAVEAEADGEIQILEDLDDIADREPVQEAESVEAAEALAAEAVEEAVAEAVAEEVPAEAAPVEEAAKEGGAQTEIEDLLSMWESGEAVDEAAEEPVEEPEFVEEPAEIEPGSEDEFADEDEFAEEEETVDDAETFVEDVDDDDDDDDDADDDDDDEEDEEDDDEFDDDEDEDEESEAETVTAEPEEIELEVEEHEEEEEVIPAPIVFDADAFKEEVEAAEAEAEAAAEEPVVEEEPAVVVEPVEEAAAEAPAEEPAAEEFAEVPAEEPAAEEPAEEPEPEPQKVNAQEISLESFLASLKKEEPEEEDVFADREEPKAEPATSLNEAFTEEAADDSLFDINLAQTKKFDLHPDLDEDEFDEEGPIDQETGDFGSKFDEELFEEETDEFPVAELEEEFEEDDFEEDFDEDDAFDEEGFAEDDAFDEEGFAEDDAFDEDAFAEEDFDEGDEFVEEDLEEDNFAEEVFVADDVFEDFPEEELPKEEFPEEDFAEEDPFSEEAIEEFNEEDLIEETLDNTDNIEIEDEVEDRMNKSEGGVSFDTGFVVQGRYDLESQSEIGLKAGMTQEQKELFSYFVPVQGMSEQIVTVLDNDAKCTDRYGTSRTGNLMIIGHKGSGKTVLAVDIIKALQKNRNLEKGRVAIIDADKLNRKDMRAIIQRLAGGALIIEQAGGLSEETVHQLNDLMEGQTKEMFVVLEDEQEPISQLLKQYPEFAGKFTSRLEVPVFINDDLVAFGQTYAKENGCKIDEMGILALYSRIDALQREDHAVTVAEVKTIMDAAIESAQRGKVKRLFKHNKDGNNRILLQEQDFKK